MKKRVPIVFMFVLFQCFQQLPACAQISGGNYEEDLLSEKTKLDDYIKNLRSFISVSGNSSLKALEGRVHFHVSDEPVPNAWVARDFQTGRNTIYMTAQYRLLTTYLADADVIVSLDTNFHSCRQDYVDTIFKVLATNRQRSVSRGTQRRIPAPEVFLNTAANSCRPFQSRFPIDPKYRPARDQTVNMVVGLGYLHELGHIAIGHPPVSLSSIEQLPTSSQRLAEFSRLMARSRLQEYQADDWAIDRFVDLSNNPLESLTNVLLTFYLAFSNLDCSLEAADSHPNGYQRFARQMIRMKDRATSAGKFTNTQEVGRLIDDLLTFASKTQQKLDCPERG
ncbi:MAG TPA: hypothetical protein PK224_03740 [Nitrospira sp.]|nr:hypothetical protein [Nitrospira sp.]